MSNRRIINWSKESNGPGIFSLPEDGGHLKTDIALRVERKGEDHFLVIASGENYFPAHMNCSGKIFIRPQDVFGHVDKCCREWEEEIDGVMEDEGVEHGRRIRRTIHAQVDLGHIQGEMKSIGFKLAEASKKLQHQVLLNRADNDAKKLFALLFDALKNNDDLTIKVTAEDFFIPWSMLYLGNSQSEDAFDWNMFVGAKHIVDHIPNISFRNPSPKFCSNQRFNVSFAQDENITCLSGIQLVFSQNQFLESCGSVNFRKFLKREELKIHVKDMSDDFHLMYFFCHGNVARDQQNNVNLEFASIKLTDDREITPGDFSFWRKEEDAVESEPFKSEPFIFLNACQSAQQATHLYQGFAPMFFELGAKCLLGPQISVPAVFAADYARKLLELMLDVDACGESPRLGILVRDLAKEFLKNHHNPLGLIYGLHAGTDVRFRKITEV
jgi:hypothetical protein